VTDPGEAPPPNRGVDWRPPQERETNIASMVVGIIFLVIGVWYLLDQTFDVDMPRIAWGDFWPILLIAIGALMLFRSASRRS
jgi:uncharacterized membrane protein HdeD (DUF308 family)